MVDLPGLELEIVVLLPQVRQLRPKGCHLCFETLPLREQSSAVKITRMLFALERIEDSYDHPDCFSLGLALDLEHLPRLFELIAVDLSYLLRVVTVELQAYKLTFQSLNIALSLTYYRLQVLKLFLEDAQRPRRLAAGYRTWRRRQAWISTKYPIPVGRLREV